MLNSAEFCFPEPTRCLLCLHHRSLAKAEAPLSYTDFDNPLYAVPYYPHRIAATAYSGSLTVAVEAPS